jgi:DNA-binding transcriptional regulator YiaG
LTKIQSNDGSYLYSNCDLPTVVVFGLGTNHCRACNEETVFIPAIEDLHTKLAGAILLKPALLSGPELRFIRSAAALNQADFAEKLGVTFATILKWEQSEALRFPNDLASRVVLASVIDIEQDAHFVFKILQSVRARRSETSRLTAYWINPEIRWIVAPVACQPA